MIRQFVSPEQKGVTEEHCPFTVEIVTDPEEIEKARVGWEHSRRNIAWWQANAQKLFSQLRGKYVVVAGQELFAADTSEEAWAQADAAHPEDQGKFSHYVPKVRMDRIYAHRRPGAAR